MTDDPSSPMTDSMTERERYEQGLRVRREVLGDEYVERALANRTPLNEEFQSFITRTAWGEVWADETLPRHTRSLLTIALLVALNRPDELRMHLRAAVRNGVSHDEIRALLLHCAIYCGVPAANAAFHLAEEVFAS
ncbi:MAG TPA: 4-carboxymuconolactone decarboxylase [Ktedonobacterales bacterium]|nr:4-carboxymuconolactone decarboxylase [Ktedonobacterales bacterium]